MTSEPILIFDANVFIEASKRYYAFDIAPGFWQQLIDHASMGNIISIDRVKAELLRHDDRLSDWAKTEFIRWFASTNEASIVQCYAKYVTWANNNDQFNPAAKYEFAQVDVADGWLIAYTETYGGVLVTDEQLSLDIKKKVKIPNVCDAFKVPYINTFEMLRRLGIRWT